MHCSDAIERYENETLTWNVNNNRRVIRCRQKQAASRRFPATAAALVITVYCSYLAQHNYTSVTRLWENFCTPIINFGKCFDRKKRQRLRVEYIIYLAVSIPRLSGSDSAVPVVPWRWCSTSHCCISTTQSSGCSVDSQTETTLHL